MSIVLVEVCKIKKGNANSLHEAVSQFHKVLTKKEIATLPLVARNDRRYYDTFPMGRGYKSIKYLDNYRNDMVVSLRPIRLD